MPSPRLTAVTALLGLLISACTSVPDQPATSSTETTASTPTASAEPRATATPDITATATATTSPTPTLDAASLPAARIGFLQPGAGIPGFVLGIEVVELWNRKSGERRLTCAVPHPRFMMTDARSL